MSSALPKAASVATQLRAEVSEPQALSFIKKSYRQAYLRFLVFVSAFYDQGRGKEDFSEAERLSHYEVQEQGLPFFDYVEGLGALTWRSTGCT